MAEKSKKNRGFGHNVGDLVLVKWNDGMVYFAKIKRIDWRKKMCVVIFDDRSTDKANFSQIHSVDETTTDIICIKCKRDNSESPNEIVLCDSCGIGFHQKCHSPAIPASALQLDSPWHCTYCQRGTKNPYLTESIDVMQSLFEEDATNEAEEGTHEVEEVVIKQEVFTDEEEEYLDQPFQCHPIANSPSPLPPRKRKGRQLHSNENTVAKKSPTKKRPLQLLRRKFARSRLGHASACQSRKRSKPDEELNDRNATDSVNLEMERISTVESQTLPVEHSSSVNLFNEQREEKSDVSSNESSNKDTPIGHSLEIDNERPPARKRPRSLRVSLTLPPSVETTPINSTTHHLHDRSLVPVGESEFEGAMNDPMETAPSSSEQNVKETPQKKQVEIIDTPPSYQGNPIVDTCTGKDAISSSSTITFTPLSVNQHAPVSTVVDSSSTSSTSQDNVEDSLVKVSPGVTQLKPTKHKRPSVTTVPVSIPSPLERLKNELKNNRKSQTDSNGTKSGSCCVISSPTTLMHSTGTISSALPISSNLQHHHARKSTAPTRAIPVSTGAVTPIQKFRQRKHSNPQSMIVISPSPSPPSAMPIAVSHPPLPVAQHIISDYNQSQDNYRSEVLTCNQVGIPSPHARSKDPATANHMISTCNTANSKQHRNRGYVFHNVQPTRTMQVQTEPLHHINEAVHHPRPQFVHQKNEPQYAQSQQQIHSQTLPVQKESCTHHSELMSPECYGNQTRAHPSNHHAQRNHHINQRIHHQIAQSSPSIPQQGNNVVHPAHSHQQPYKTAQTVPPQYHTAVKPVNSDVVMLTPTTLCTKDGSAVYTLMSTAQLPAPHGTVMSAPMQAAAHTDPVPLMGSLTATVHPTVDASANQRKVIYNTVPGKDVQSGVVASNTTACYAMREVPKTPDQIGQQSGVIQQPSISTTKPYAVVSAFPGQANLNRKASPPPPSPPASLKIPPPGKKASSSTYQSEKEVRSGEQSHKSAQKQMQEIAHIREEATSNLTEQLQSFSHKYKDFERFTPDDLMEIFHGALKKFQKSSKMYDSYSKKPVHEKIASPNVQVCPQLGSPLHLKYGSFSQQSVQSQVPCQSPNTAFPPRSKYSGPATAQMPLNKPHRSYQVHTSGVFVPPPEANARTPSCKVHNHSAHHTQQDSVHTQHQSSTAHVQAGNVMRHQQNIPLAEPSIPFDSKSTGTVIVQRVPPEKHRRKPDTPTNIHHMRGGSVQISKGKESCQNQEVMKRVPDERRRICAGCNKDATFLCSGCHKVWYCGRDCQVKSWDKHMNSCKS